MISQTLNTWQSALKNCITQADELMELLNLDKSLLSSIQSGSEKFALRVPRGFLARMEKGNPTDPLLLQILPQTIESAQQPGYLCDPLAESQANPLPGLLHKYSGRVLITLANGCAINCRYCFRREFPYHKNTLGKKGLEKILEYIQQDTSLFEVILSGGDPLLANDTIIEHLIAQLETISHIKILRIHSRIPIVLPERITPHFTKLLSDTRLKSIMVVHCNHPNEIDNSVIQAVNKLNTHNIPVLNQSVLLKNINDSAEILEKLSLKLFETNIMPYYLHLPDKVQGTAHFDVSIQTGQAIMAKLSARLPGYLVPKLVSEETREKALKLLLFNHTHPL